MKKANAPLPLFFAARGPPSSPYAPALRGAERREALGAERRTPWPALRSGRSLDRQGSPANDAGRRASRRSTAAFSFRRRAALSTAGGRAFAQAPRPSASSWQGAVVPPGGAPTTPECVLCEARPQAPHRPRPGISPGAGHPRRKACSPASPSVRPASTTPREAPLSGRGCAEYNGDYNLDKADREG
jgi:hypothetical protein